MLKATIIGKLVKVSEPEKKESFMVQKIQIEVKEFDRTTGEAKETQTFEVAIFNKKIEELKAIAKVERNVIATCWLKSLKSEKEGKVFYNLVLNCSDLVTK